MKTIFIIFTKYNDPLSQLLYYTTGFGYTHVAIGLNSDNFFSFTFKGFSKENLAKYKRNGVTKSAIYSLQVSEQFYQRIEELLNYAVINKHQLKYSKVGIMLCFLRIPFTRQKHYFCSQYVAELLKNTGVMKTRKHASLFFPNHLFKELATHAGIISLEINPVSAISV